MGSSIRVRPFPRCRWRPVAAAFLLAIVLAGCGGSGGGSQQGSGTAKNCNWNQVNWNQFNWC